MSLTGKYWGSAYWSCNINLKWTKNIPLIFHNLKGYDSYLIRNEIGKSNVKVSVLQLIINWFLLAAWNLWILVYMCWLRISQKSI